MSKKEETKSELDSLISETMNNQGFMKKEHLDGLLNATKDVTIKQVLDHGHCDNPSGCSVCQMKDKIDGTAFKRGVLGGMKIGQKFPKLNFNMEDQ